MIMMQIPPRYTVHKVKHGHGYCNVLQEARHGGNLGIEICFSATQIGLPGIQRCLVVDVST
jgi:hypothetical protein